MMDMWMTGDEIAIALTGVQHALAWWKEQPACNFRKKRNRQA